MIGAGQMGNGIAHVCALAGYSVLLNDVSADRIKAGLATINGNMARQVAQEDRSARMTCKSALVAHQAGGKVRRACRLRSGDRDRDRKGRGQAQDLLRVCARCSNPTPSSRPIRPRSRSRGWRHRPTARSASSAFTS